MKDLTDEQLMERVASGDQRAFEALHSRHDTLVRRIVRKRVNTPEHWDDITQELWLVIIRNAHRYNQECGAVVAWIATIAGRRSIDMLRKVECYNGMLQRAGDAALAEWQRDPAIDAAVPGGDMDRKDLLAAAKSLLPPAQWQVIELCFVKGLTQREVVEVTGVALGTIKTRWELALRKLREFLEQQDLPCARTTARDTRPSIRSATIVPVRASGNGHTRRSRPSGRAGASVTEGRVA